MLDDESPTSPNLENDLSFGEAQNKTTRAYTQSGQYHTVVESRVQNLYSKWTISYNCGRKPKTKPRELNSKWTISYHCGESYSSYGSNIHR